MSLSDPNSDAWLDAKLREVSVPDDLSVRLRTIADCDDQWLDTMLRDVPIPVGLSSQLERIGRRGARFERAFQLATAASVFVSVGLAYLGAVFVMLLTSMPSPPSELPSLTTSFGLDALEGHWADPQPLDIGALDLTGLESARFESPSQALQGLTPEPSLAWEIPSPLSDSPVIELHTLLGQPDIDLMEDIHRASWSKSIRASDQFDLLPDLEKVSGLKPRGINFPLVPGYDIAMLSRTGFHPFVPPFASPELCRIEVPLGIETSSFDLLCRYLEDGQLPPRDSLRTEEFLASIDFRFPPPRKQESLSLHVSGGPAPFRPKGMQLLQFGVRAKDIPMGKHQPVRLTMCVDVSASMRFGGRLAMVRDGLAGLIDQFQADDRINLVMFGEDGYVLVEGLRAEDKTRFSEALAVLTAEGATHLGAGLRQAFAVAQRSPLPKGHANRVVLLTDGQAQLDLVSIHHITRRLREAADDGIRFDVIDLGQESLTEATDSQLSQLATAGNGSLYQASGIRQVRWSMEEILGGQSRRVASAVKLSIELSPRSVAAYRLFGHEPRTVIGLNPARLETDFFASQSATALFELQWTRHPEKEVGRVTLHWTTPADGKKHTATRVIHRNQFAKDLLHAPLSLQAAAITVNAAEVLRASPYSQAWTHPDALANVIHLAEQLDTQLFEQPDMVEFLSVLQRASMVKPSRVRGR